MISRRNFIRNAAGLFVGAAIAPKLIFDLGANSYKNQEPDWLADWLWVNKIPNEDAFVTSINPDYEKAFYEEVILQGAHPFKLYYENKRLPSNKFQEDLTKLFEPMYPRRFDKDGIEVLPFISKAA